MLGSRWGRTPLLAAVLLLLGVGAWFVGGWYSSGPLAQDTAFTVPDGSSLSGVAAKLEREGVIASASAFKLRARIFGAGSSIKAGEFMIPRARRCPPCWDGSPGMRCCAASSRSPKACPRSWSMSG